MIRSAVTKYKGSPLKTTGPAVLKGPHAHGCITCHGRYEDSCATSYEGGECATCRGQEPWSLLIANRLPKDCCRAHSRPASKEDRDRYALSPACPWFLCVACHRTHPFENPTEVHA